ncbi:MAG: LysE family translocator [Rhodobacteraceae bacterium]|nr:LysE family translocator [Paracoccaceae bacterium]
MTWEIYLLYLAALGAFFATPPDLSQFLIMSNSLRHGVRRSLWTVAGDLTANSLQMTVAAFGLAAVIALSATALTLVKWLGVAYLAYLGVSLLFRGPAKDSSVAAENPNAPALFRQGFLTSSANPYAVVFFGALFPQFIDPAAPVWPQLAILGLTYLVVDGVLLVTWGWAASQAAAPLKRLGGIWMNRISGGLTLMAAVLLASKDLAVEARR